LTPPVSRRSIAKVTRRIGQRTPQFPPHPLLPGFDEAFAQHTPCNRNERIEVERHAVRILFGSDSLLFTPAPEDVPQFSCEMLGRLARRHPSPRRPDRWRTARTRRPDICASDR
jgi:hypothetical protein